MRIAILGDGLLGRTVAAALAPLPFTTLLTHADIDVTDPASCKRALAPFDAVVNTVALHQLGDCERRSALAHSVNTTGAANVARRVPTAYISTDYVFNDDGPHSEALPGDRPRSVYGRTKLGGELATLESGGIVIRVSALFGHERSHKGPTFPETVLSSHDPIRLPTDQVFSPTYAPDAATRIAAGVVALAERPMVNGRCFPGCGHELEEYNCSKRPSGIYHAANDGSTSWAAFGQEIADLTRHDRHISGYEARDPLRPKNSSLISTRLPPLRHFRAALLDWEAKRER